MKHKMKGIIPNDLSYTNTASPIVEAKSQATKPIWGIRGTHLGVRRHFIWNNIRGVDIPYDNQ
jgi:hypothetical protein